jgi:ectoine hydroxylase-related dioxygenase (phytanoyl-CoA dioxygenase family)
MFNSAFSNFSTTEIVKDLKTKGYFVFEQALNEQYVDELLQEIDFDRILINTNDVGVVIASDIKFLTHCLANSKKSYDVISSRKVLDICKEYFIDSYKLTNHRVYKTSKKSHMPWHTDNNLQSGKQLSAKHNMPGLLFLIYLSDVTTNPFQLVKNSQTWSPNYQHEIYLSDSFIENSYSQDILTLPMKKGSVIVCDIHAVHRAEPFKDKDYTRYTLLFQVDQVGNEYIGHGEKNLVNTEYLENVTPELMDYLGFGFKRDYPAFPNSSIATMKLPEVWNMQKQLLSQTFQALTKKLAINLLPGGVIVNAKRMIWNLKLNRSNKN